MREYVDAFRSRGLLPGLYYSIWDTTETNRIFKRPFLWPELYRSPGRVVIPVLLDEKSTVVPVRLAGEQSGGKRKVSCGDARSNSERAAPSAWVGKRLSAPQIV